MTIYYTLTFMLLAAEMATFCVLVAPLPYTLRRKLFKFLSESIIISKIAYGLKISFIFVGVLFVDAIQRMFRATAEADLAKSHGGSTDVRTETNFAARKFYSQRNTYLTGFCLFLSLVLTRTFYMMVELIQTQEEYKKLKATKAITSSEELKQQFEASQKNGKDLEILRKQALQLSAEYNALADRYNKATGQKSSDKRKD